MQAMESHVRVLCRRHRGHQLAAALLKLARSVTRSPSGLLVLVTDGSLPLRLAATPDLQSQEWLNIFATDVTADSWSSAWATVLCRNAAVLTNVPHYLGRAPVRVNRSLAVPLWLANKFLGIFLLANKSEDYRADEASLILQIAHYSASELREQVEDRRETDEGNARPGAGRWTSAASPDANDFLAALAHGLQDSLSSVIARSDLLLGTSLTRQQQDHVESLRQIGRSALVSVNDALELTHRGGERIVFELMPFALADLVTRTRHQLSERATATGLSIELSFDQALPRRLFGAPRRVQQVLYYLIENALRHATQPKIRLTVSIKLRTQTGLMVGFVVEESRKSEYSQITGLSHPSSPPHELDTQDAGNADLQATICERLVHLMGGRLRRPGVSGNDARSSFTARFNCLPDERASVAASSVREHRLPALPQPRDRLLLIVEDNPINQLVLVRMVRRLGYQAEVVPDGAAAIAAVGRTNYDLVLMDCHMPKMNGFEATRRIRAGEASTSDIPIVAVTAGASRAQCLDAGMNDYLVKPIDLSIIRSTLKKWLPDET